MDKESKVNSLRKFGIEIVDAIPWGTHLCQFYETKQDLIDILVPFFSEGLRSNEFCMWVTSPPLEVEKAEEALRRAVPSLDAYRKRGQIEIISYDDWYLLDGKFDSRRVLQGWVEKKNAALERGFDGLRLTGNTFWIERELWKSFVDYEEAMNAVIGRHKMIAVCTYCLTKCTGTRVLDVVRNHVGTLVKKRDKWYLVEDAARRKAASGALKLSEQRYSALFENIQDGFAYHKIILDKKGKPIDYIFLEINEAFERLTGLKREKVLGKAVTQVLPGIENDPADWIGIYGKVALTGEPARFENYAEPLQRWYLVSAYSPEKGYFAVTFEDITEHKKTEQEIAGLARFPSENPHIVLRLDKNGTVMYSNPAGQILLNKWNIKVGERAPKKIALLMADAFVSASTIEYEEKVGKQIFLFTLAPIIKEAYVNIYGIDITERKKAEEMLSEQNVAISSAPDAVFSTDNSFVIKSWNKAAERIFGWAAEEVIGKASTSIFSIVYPTLDGITREQATEELMNSGFWRGEVIYHKKDDAPIPVSVSVSLVKDQNGSVTGMVAVVHDITARKKREKAFEEAQHDLKHAQAVAKTGSWRLDTQRNVLLWSDENHRIFGVPKGTPMTYETFLSIVHPDDRKYVDTKWKAGLRGESYDIEHRIIVDGNVKWVRERAELEFDDDGTLLGGFGTTQEITDLVELRQELEDSRVQLEEYSSQMEHLADERAKKLKDAERLAAIGATAGMVGHDIRNPLQAIVGDLYLLGSDLALMPESEEKESMKESLEDIKKNLEYIDKIVQDLQDFAEPLKPTVQETDFEALCNEALLENDFPENIDASYKVKEEAKSVIADPTLLKRILSNLTNNAVQAMPDGGKLKICAYKDADEFVITVQDTGVGVPEEVKSKLFTPLFTTKSKGQGFGLAVVKRMAEALNGTVTFESEKGKGTKFVVRFYPKKRSNGK